MSTIQRRKWLSMLVFLFANLCRINAYAGFLVVTIERVIARDDFDPGVLGVGGSEADFYAIVNIDGKEEVNRDDFVGDKNDIYPHWQFSKAVDLSRSSVPVAIGIADVDGFLRFDDDNADVSIQPGPALTLQVNPPPCQVLGPSVPASGNCGDLLVSQGDSSPRAEIHFRIEIVDINSFPSLAWDVVPADPTISEPFDPNHLLFNPRWGWQTTAVAAAPKFENCPSTAACTQQFPMDDFPGWSVPFVCHSSIIGTGGQGHTNWEVITYRGLQIHWDTYESAIWADDDYSLNLDTPITNGFVSGGTAANPGAVLLEFKAAETIDHFGQTPYWRSFRDAVDNDDSNPNQVNGKEAIAIGLLGLDRVHDAHSELHPVYALAIHTNTDPADDTWAIFARNFGNEGMCSDAMHYADFRTLTIQLPRPAGVVMTVAPRIISSAFWGNAGGSIDLFSGANQDTFISFHMGATPNNGDEGDRASGELHLSWVGGARARSRAWMNETAEKHTYSTRADPDEPEDVLGQLFQSLTPQQRETYLAIVPPQPPRSDDLNRQSATFLTGTPPPVTTKPPLFAVKNPSQEQRQRDILNGYCGSFGGHLPPGHLGSCNDLLPFTRLVHIGQQKSTGWYTDPVTITLIGVDVNGKGIDHTEYNINGQSFIRHSAPFPLPDGVSTVSYRSQDRAGSFETTKDATFRVDTILPQSSLSIGLPQYGAGPPVVISSQTPLTVTGTDSGSGVASVSYRFFRDGTPLVSYTTTAGSSVQFKVTGADAIYRVDTLVIDVAGNQVEQRQKIQLSNSADLAIVSLALVSPPPPFVVVGTPIQLLVRTILVNLGLVHPVDGTLSRHVLDTADMTLTPTDVTQTETALEQNQQRVLDQTYTVTCAEKRSTNSVVFTSKIDLSTNLPGITDNNLSNNQKSLTIQMLCKVPWRPGVTYHVGDEVVFSGLVSAARQSHTAQVGWEPPRTYALWARIPVADEWAPQVIYQTGDVVVFAGHHYTAVQGHQALEAWTPPSVPALWSRLD